MNQLPHPEGTRAGAWAPDWRALKRTRDRAIVNIPYANDDQFNEAAYGAIVSEYQRQAAAAGLVMVRRELLEHFFGMIWGGDRTTWPAEIQAALAATPESAPGGEQ